MATKPLTSEAIALHEKKMDMTLDDIIKMSKKPTQTVKKHRVPNKGQKFFSGGAAARGNLANGNAVKVRQFMDTRSSLRQGALAHKRSNFQANHFPLAAEVARKAAAAPTGNRPFNRSRPVNWNKPRVGAPPFQRTAEGRFGVKQQQHQQLQGKMIPKQQRPQTLDSLFANMKEQRMRVQSQQQNNARRGGFGPQQQQQQQQQRAAGWGRGRFGNLAN